jgi:membrane fusion protein (multidrug efflux system)
MALLARLSENPRLRRLLLMIALPLVLAVLGLWYWSHSERYQDTDNAYVVADQVNVAPQVTGRVIQVPVAQNQAVQPDQLLLQLDPAPFKIALDQATANLESVRNQIRVQQAQYLAAEANAAYLQREVNRKTNLAKQDVVSSSKLDDLKTGLTVARQEIAQISASLNGDPNLPYSEQASYKQALAARDQAALQLSYATLKAPAAGVVTEVDIKPGDIVTAGRPVFALVMSGNRWVEANFKETQLTRVHVGQKVEVRVDTYPSRKWLGTIQSIAPGTGSVFSVLPAQNATGNWVKVVQRIPVRIALSLAPGDPDLRAGMSAEVDVDTHYNPFFGEASADPGDDR